MQKPAWCNQRAVPTDTRDASYTTQQVTRRNKTRWTTILIIPILVASFLAGNLREEAVMVPARAPLLAMCSKPLKRSAKLSKAQVTIAQASVHSISRNSQTSCTGTNISGRYSNQPSQGSEHRMLQANSDPAPCWLPVLQRHEESPEAACSYWAQDLHSLAFPITGQTETLDPFQRALAHQLLPQQPINSVIHPTELPHCKGQRLALQAVHSPRARYSGSGAPSTSRSKGMPLAQRRKDGWKRKRLTDYQQVLPWQVALTANPVTQTSNSGTNFSEKQGIKTYDTHAHCLPSTIQRSNTTQLKVAAAMQNSQALAINSVTIASVDETTMQHRKQHLPTHIHHAHSCTELVWPAMYKYAVQNSDRVSMSWPLEHVECTLWATPPIPDLDCLTALKMTITDHLSKMHLDATLKCMAGYLLAFTLLTCQAGKFLMMIIWISLTMFATALQTTRPGTHRHQIRTPWLTQTTQCIAYMLWLLFLILGHAASNVHCIAAIFSAIMLTKTPHVLIMCILILYIAWHSRYNVSQTCLLWAGAKSTRLCVKGNLHRCKCSG